MASILQEENVEFIDKELAHIVKTFYPDIRKVLNNVQACIRNSKLSIEGKSFTKSNYVKEIVELILRADTVLFIEPSAEKKFQ